MAHEKLSGLFIATACAAILSGTSPANAKACVQLTGGACQGHWSCTTADGSSGFCDDPPGTDCYCKKGKKTKAHKHRTSEDNPAYMENYHAPATTSAPTHHANDSEGPPPGPPSEGQSDDRKPPKWPDNVPNTPQQP
jgi:hypothetical protein